MKSLQEGNQQLKAWVLSTAGNRVHGTTFEKPLVRFEEIERSQLHLLPSTVVEIAVWRKASLYRNCHIRLDKCYYSAPYGLYGKALWVKITRSLVTVYYQQESVAVHARLFKPGEISTKTAHLPPKAKYYLERDADWCYEESTLVREHTQTAVITLLTAP